MADNEDEEPGYTPQQEQRPAPQMNQPTGEASLPDVGDAPDFAYESPGEFASNVGGKIKEDIGKGVDNLKNSPPIKRIVSYLMGDGAAAPQRAAQLVQQVKANDPQMSDDDANLLAVHEAARMGGPAAAWQMVQYNRMAYNAKQSFAKAALNGVDGKAGDLAAAAQAATQAGSHILDGTGTIFNAGPDGITATVRLPGTSQQATYRLTPQQFDQYLDTGRLGQWDRVMNEGVPGTLQKLAGQGGDQDGDDDADVGPQIAARGKAFGQTPSTMDLAEPGTEEPGLRGYKPVGYDPFTDDNANLQDKANFLYPSASQQDQNRAYQAQQENVEAERQNKLDVANAGNETKERIAGIQAGSRQGAAATRAEGERYKADRRKEGQVESARVNADARAKSDQQKALQFARKMEQQSSDARMRERGRMARSAISNPNFLLQTDEQRNAIYQKFGIDMGGAEAPQAPTPQAPASGGQQNGQQQNGQQGVPPVNQRVTGQVYSTPKGKFRWMGNGWQPVQ